MSILVLNAGSSTLKFAVFDERAGEELASGAVDWRGGDETTTLTLQTPETGEKHLTINAAGHADAVDSVLRSLQSLDDPIRVVGHRVVHGGTEFRQACLIDERVLRTLKQVSKLAPLHNPPALATIEASHKILPAAAQVARV